MKSMDSARYPLGSFTIAALLAGCGGSQPPIGTPSAMLQSHAIATHAEHGGSWMLPEAISQTLLYISDNQNVVVYSYRDYKLEGIIKRFYLATGACTDKSGDVFIVNTGTSQIFEYQHGGTKRVASLQSPTKDPVGCAIDPVTGDLALGSEGFGSAASISVFKRARGKAKVFTDSSFYQFYFCGYDDKGNLFADGLTAPGSGHFGLAELVRGANAIANVTVDQYVTFPGGVEWDGKHLAIGDQLNSLYEFSIAGYNATLVGTINLGSASYVKQSWIQGQTLIAPNIYIKKEAASDVLIYDYPSGGRPTVKITKAIKGAQAAVVSLASH